ncbi:MAG: methionine--tRNA ligase subunit beta [Chlamydiae bacterium]|nr:methionine--tRNA ligase subunit beta [Chlamydiota bacterium]
MRFDAKKPWLLLKDSSQKEELDKVMALCLYVLKVLALVSYPVIPESAKKLYAMLGFTDDLATCDIKKELKIVSFNSSKLKTPEILFKKVEEEVIEQEEALLKNTTQKREIEFEPLKPACTIDQVDLLDLRVGEILEVEKVEKSKKLLKLKVDLGFEMRTIVSGIALDVSIPSSLIGKKVIIVANLQPAKLMGIESQGMLLAGSLGTSFEIPALQELPAGARVR